jgi:hypothetical protein
MNIKTCEITFNEYEGYAFNLHTTTGVTPVIPVFLWKNELSIINGVLGLNREYILSGSLLIANNCVTEEDLALIGA